MNYSNRAKKRSSILLWSGLLAVIGLTACNREQVQSYSISKGDPATAPANSMSAPGMGGALPAGHPDMGGTARPSLTWKTPANWTELQASQMRVGSFEVKGADGKTADVSIIPLGGPAGGDFANVNRWREQTGLPALSEEEIQKSAEHVEVGGQPADLYTQAGKDPASGNPLAILAALQHRDGTTWFYKMTGDPEVITDQKSAFVEFLKSVKFGAAEAVAMNQLPMGGGALPAGHPDISMTSMTPAPADGPISHEGQPTWQPPAGWKEVSGGQFLIGKFTITGDAGTQAAVNVSSSPGDGGGVEANVNRWRGQLGLAPLAGADLTKALTSMDVAGGKASLVEMSGKDARTGQDTQLVGVIVSQPAQTWFYKLMGDAKVVEAQKNAFTQFVKTVKY